MSVDVVANCAGQGKLVLLICCEVGRRSPCQMTPQAHRAFLQGQEGAHLPDIPFHGQARVDEVTKLLYTEEKDPIQETSGSACHAATLLARRLLTISFNRRGGICPQP